MNSEFLNFIKPYLISTQVLVSKRDLNLEEIITYCSDPGAVEQSGRKNLYKVFGDLFSLYKTDAPRDIYELSPKSLNTYANVYGRYVFQRPVVPFDDVMAWQNILTDMYDKQEGRPYDLLVRMLQVDMFGEDTLEISIFICNILALALNGQQIILTPATYAALKYYYRTKNWEAITELVMFYCRYREFLSRELAYSFNLYMTAIQYGYPEVNNKDGKVGYVLNTPKYTFKARYNTGTSDWMLTAYDKGKGMLGSVTYTDITSRCAATGKISAKLLADAWYSVQELFHRNSNYSSESFTQLYSYVTKNGKKRPLVARHLRDNFEWTNGDVTLLAYTTGYSRMIHVRRSNKLLCTIECCDNKCTASTDSAASIISAIDLVTKGEETPLEAVLENYIKMKYTGDPSVKTVVAAIVAVLRQYDVRGLEVVQANLPLNKV